MEDERYTVSQVEELTGIKGHVLRYWEEELELIIGRNAMGHRCYTRYDVQMFLNIKELKSRGLQLRAIKELVPKISQKGPGAARGKVKLIPEKETPKTEKSEQETRQQERMAEFQRILERLILAEMKGKSREERRCRSLDEAIRIHQQNRREAAAAAGDKKRQGKIRLFRKKGDFPVKEQSGQARFELPKSLNP